MPKEFYLTPPMLSVSLAAVHSVYQNAGEAHLELLFSRQTRTSMGTIITKAALCVAQAL